MQRFVATRAVQVTRNLGTQVPKRYAKPFAQSYVKPLQRRFATTGKELTKVKETEDPTITLNSLIPKEFNAESTSYVTGQRIKFYEKIFEEGSWYIGSFVVVFILLPATIKISTKGYIEFREHHDAYEDKRNSRY